MGTLERAIAIAAKAHEGQTDKAGAPYILHPLKVMMRVMTLEERIAAVLHDVVEDSDLSRIKNPTDMDHERVAKYRRAIEQIQALK